MQGYGSLVSTIRSIFGVLILAMATSVPSFAFSYDEDVRNNLDTMVDAYISQQQKLARSGKDKTVANNVFLLKEARELCFYQTGSDSLYNKCVSDALAPKTLKTAADLKQLCGDIARPNEKARCITRADSAIAAFAALGEDPSGEKIVQMLDARELADMGSKSTTALGAGVAR